MAYHVHIADKAPAPEYLSALHASLDAAIEVSTGPETDAPERTQALVSGWPSEGILDRLTPLDALVIPFAGLPVSTAKRVAGRSIRVYNLHHNAAAASEMAIALLFAAAKCIVPMDQSLRASDWRPRYAADPGVMLSGRRALVLGYGAIGRRIAAALAALDMDVTAIRRSNKDLSGPIPIHTLESLPALLPKADVLMSALPGTPQTRGLLGAAQLECLPPKAIFVNVGRARVVDEQALYAALETGALHSAGLDVWYQYPKDAASREDTAPSVCPFHTLDNVVLSPHRAGHGAASERLRGIHLANTLNALAEGIEPACRVCLEAGY